MSTKKQQQDPRGEAKRHTFATTSDNAKPSEPRRGIKRQAWPGDDKAQQSSTAGPADTDMEKE